VGGRDPGPSPPSRLVLNLRFIVGFYHAVVLEFYRVAYFHQPLSDEGKRAVQRILDLAVIVHECEGNDSLTRLSWPMFMAGIETSDRVHQNWLMERLQGLSGYGKNVVRAHRLLEAVVKRQRSVPGRVDYFQWFQSGVFERFVMV
jgi:Fungal specific transcription factor domain